MRDSLAAKKNVAWPKDRVVRRPLTQHQKITIGSAEPAYLAFTRQLLNPVIAVLVLIFWTLVVARDMTAPYIALAALTFLVTGQVFSGPELEGVAARRLNVATIKRIFVDWTFVTGILLMLAFATRYSQVFSRLILFVWFVSTPFAIIGAQALVRETICYLLQKGLMVRRQIIVGANEMGCELARRL